MAAATDVLVVRKSRICVKSLWDRRVAQKYSIYYAFGIMWLTNFEWSLES